MEDSDLSTLSQVASAASTSAGLKPGQPTATSDKMLAAILATLDENKAEDVLQINLRGRSEIGDWMVIATGRSSRQVSAISDHVVDMLKADLGILSKTEGKATGDWVLIDAGDVIVHLFRPEVRDFYQLEKLWMPAGEIDTQ